MLTFNMFVILMGLIVVSIAFMHFTQGFFTAAISAILAIFSAVLAVSYHEMVVESLLGGAMADNAHGAVVLIMFSAIYLALRLTFDKLIPGGLAMPPIANKIGGAAMGVVAGVFAAGVCAFAAQSMPFNPAVLGYSRLPVEEASAMVPKNVGDKRLRSHPLYDFLTQNSKPLHEADSNEQQKMYVPADDILVDTVMRLSDRGALSAGKPLATIHPDWLMEMFGQRLGIEAAGKHVAMNLKEKPEVMATKDDTHKDAGVYLLDQPLPQKAADFSSISKLRFDETQPFDYRPGEQSIAIVHRVYFSGKAKDTRDSLIRLSMGSVRICTHKKSVTGEMEPFNYYPVGTLEDVSTVYLQRPDDYVFIDDSLGGEVIVNGKSEVIADKAIDLVFVIDAPGFLEGDAVQPPAKRKAGEILAKPDAWETFVKKAKISEGTFIEVKRLARIDLSGQPLRSFAELPFKKAVAVLRKEAIKPTDEQVMQEKAQMAELLKKFRGVFYATSDDKLTTLTVTDKTFMKVVNDAQGKLISNTTGTWKPISAIEGVLKISTQLSTGGKPPETTEMNMTFSGEESVNIVDAQGLGTSYDKKRPEFGTANTPTPGTPTPGTPTPGTPTPGTPTPGTPIPGVPVDQTLKVALDTLQENPKFYAQINVPASSAGDVTVDGGTANVDSDQIKGLKLDGADPAKLKGTGVPIIRLLRADGTVVFQVEAVPGPAAAGGWAWKDKVDQIVAVDSKGGQHKCVGAWALTVDGKLYARYTSSGTISMADLAAPAGPPTKVYLAFETPEGTELKKIQVGQAPVLGGGQ